MRALLLALGCDRTSGEDDDIFDLPDTPRVLSIPVGLSVRIGGAVAESEIRDVMVPHLRQSEAGVRWAAALALADSAGFPEVRAAFLDSVRSERDPATQGELGKALADWAAGQAAESADRLGIFSAILEGADRPEAASLRLRSEEGMKRMAWTSPEVRLMAGRIESGTLDQKRWAIAVLAGAAARSDLPDRSVVLDVFSKASASASEAKVREFAVSGLVAFPEDARACQILLGSLRDPAWHVRSAAVRALGRNERTPEILAALQRVEREDPDERVRRAAGETRKTSTSK
jgi:HEAT repeat protein